MKPSLPYEDSNKFGSSELLDPKYAPYSQSEESYQQRRCQTWLDQLEQIIVPLMLDKMVALATLV